VHRPDHPAKVVPVAGAAVNTTFDALVKLAAHVPGQLIPAGLLVTVPVPVPASCTVMRTPDEVKLNVAVTEAAAVSVKVHVPVPLHAPDQPANVEPVPGVAVSVTAVPTAMLPLHVVPQLIPAGLLVTAPAPVPAFCTVS